MGVRWREAASCGRFVTVFFDKILSGKVEFKKEEYTEIGSMNMNLKAFSALILMVENLKNLKVKRFRKLHKFSI